MTKNIFIYLLFSFFSFSLAQEEGKSYSGSISINPKTGIFSSISDVRTDSEADRNSLIRCNKKNKMKNVCKVAVTFSNSCGAVAWSKNLKIASGGWADSDLSKAKKAAVKACTERGASDCKIVEAFCTSWEETVTTTVWW